MISNVMENGCNETPMARLAEWAFRKIGGVS